MSRWFSILGSSVMGALVIGFVACSGGGTNGTGPALGPNDGDGGNAPGPGSVVPDGGVEAAAVDPCPGVDLSSDGAMDFDLSPVQVTGKVTLNGGAFPSGTEARGAIWFRRDSGGVVSVPVPTSASTYAVTLAAGTYQIGYSSGGACADDHQLPCNGGIIQRDVRITADGALDLDVRSVGVQGRVTVNGAPFDVAEIQRGSIAFSQAEEASATGTARSVAIGAAGTFATTLLAGTYGVAYAPAKSCSATRAGGVPCNGGMLKTAVPLSTGGALDLDVATVRVQGKVTLNGGPLPAERRGALVFARDGGKGGAATVAPDSGGDGTYAATLLSGTYDVLYTPTSTSCSSTVAGGVPCNGGTLKSAMALTTSGNLDLDVPTVRVQGTVTVNGAALPVETVGRGTLVFTPTGGALGTKVTIAETDAPTYSATLFRGTYDVGYDGVESRCSAGAPSSAWPCNAAIVTSAKSLTADGALDVDVPSVRVEGRVTLRGAVMPDRPSGRGAVAFAQPKGSPLILPALPGSGEATYAATLVRGTYDIMYRASDDVCEEVAPFPCNNGVVRQGALLASSGALDIDVHAVNVRGNVTVSKAVPAPASSTRGRLSFALKTGAPALTDLFEDTGPIPYSVSLLAGKYVITYAANEELCTDTQVRSPMPCNDAVLAGCR